LNAHSASAVTAIHSATELVRNGTQRPQKVWRRQNDASAANRVTPVAP
jgi:hypothetical protein